MMNVYRRNSNGRNESSEISKKLQLDKAFQSKKKASKIKKAIKDIIVSVCKAIGKTTLATGVTALIVVATDLIGVANASRPSFAIGGEWILIAYMFVGILFVIEWILTKSKNSNERRTRSYEDFKRMEY